MSSAGPGHSPPGGGFSPPHKERSRNARAQARHRAKRKAYIEQLEATVTKLQCMVPLNPDQINALSPPQMRVRELEEENRRLRSELVRYRTGSVVEPYSPPPLGPPSTTSTSTRGPGITGLFADNADYDRRTRYTSDARSGGAFGIAGLGSMGNGPVPMINTNRYTPPQTPLLTTPTSVSSSSSTYNPSNSRTLPAPGTSGYYSSSGPHGPAYPHHLTHPDTSSGSSTSSPPAGSLPPIERRDSPGYSVPRGSAHGHSTHTLPGMSSNYPNSSYGGGRVPPMKTEEDGGYAPYANSMAYDGPSPTSPAGWFPSSSERHH